MSRRERLHQETIQEIKTIARRQMAELGSASISLSAIARELGITQPGLYRYFASRDDLITALIVDAFTHLADALEAAPQNISTANFSGRLTAVLLAYRAWALQHPVDFSLIYGSPIPGYHAPRELTLPPAQRTLAVILDILSQAQAAGVLHPPARFTHLPDGLSVYLPTPQDPTAAAENPLVLYIALAGWYHIHGMIMLELFEHNTALISNMDLFYRHEVAAFLQAFGL